MRTAMTKRDAHGGWAVSSHFPSHPGEVGRRRPLWVSRRAPSLTRMSDGPTTDGGVEYLPASRCCRLRWTRPLVADRGQASSLGAA